MIDLINMASLFITHLFSLVIIIATILIVIIIIMIFFTEICDNYCWGIENNSSCGMVLVTVEHNIYAYDIKHIFSNWSELHSRQVDI